MSDPNPGQVLKSKECSTNQTIGHLDFMLASGFDPGIGISNVMYIKNHHQVLIPIDAVRTGHEKCKGFISRLFDLCGCSFLDYLHNENECNLHIDDGTKEELSEFYSGPLENSRILIARAAHVQVNFDEFGGFSNFHT